MCVRVCVCVSCVRALSLSLLPLALLRAISLDYLSAALSLPPSRSPAFSPLYFEGGREKDGDGDREEERERERWRGRGSGVQCGGGTVKYGRPPPKFCSFWGWLSGRLTGRSLHWLARNRASSSSAGPLCSPLAVQFRKGAPSGRGLPGPILGPTPVRGFFEPKMA